VTRSQIVQQAREWVGTPFQWQASQLGKGCDCKGLVWGVARALGMPEASSPFAAICDYRDVPEALLLRGMRETFRKVLEPDAGNVVLMRVSGRVQHMGIATGTGRIIHCFAKAPRRVIEAPLAPLLALYPLDSIWSWPSLRGDQ
jgi:NlpC/P60 family putative phage cell wall peptidase